MRSDARDVARVDHLLQAAGATGGFGRAFASSLSKRGIGLRNAIGQQRDNRLGGLGYLLLANKWARNAKGVNVHRRCRHATG
ncbi:MAG: hypothetical protein IPK54_08730 [Dokdonella sp.]|uniref:hypothetical protein n=1 Tax=Dokdonella sp. TaxID=2291710 RepID=UPI0025BB9415|nr:hypothetical protein [Dokdonella sp.]MBK8123617.1 hypothetical protein [Dokdonella sp.]